MEASAYERLMHLIDVVHVIVIVIILCGLLPWIRRSKRIRAWHSWFVVGVFGSQVLCCGTCPLTVLKGYILEWSGTIGEPVGVKPFIAEMVSRYFGIEVPAGLVALCLVAFLASALWTLFGAAEDAAQES